MENTENRETTNVGLSKKELRKKNRNVFLRLMKYARPYTGRMLIALVLMLGITALELYKPSVLGDVIDLFCEGAEFDEIKTLGIFYVIAMVLTLVFNVTQTWILQLTGQQIVYNVRQEVMDHVHHLSLSYFDVTPVGRIVTRVTNDVESLSEMFSSILVRLIRNAVMVIGLAVTMLLLDVRLSLRAFILVPVVCLATWLFEKVSRTCYRITRSKITALNIYLSEHLSGMKLIQSFAREHIKRDEFKEKSAELFNANFREVMVYAIFRPLIYMLYVIALVSIIGGGGELVLANNNVLGTGITVGVLYKFVQYIGNFFDPIQELAEQLGTLQQAFASAEKIFSILDEKEMIHNPENPVKIPSVKGRIEFDHVWFAYNGEDWILKDVSFVIEPGKKVAFVGATGAGKTTVLSLIGRYYEIQKGRILVDGTDIRMMDKNQLRRSIGQVQQDVFIFTGDIAGNIRLLDDSITDEDIRRAAHIANADRFIEKLDNGYAQAVTERGSTLSAGERQLLSFARTLAFDPAILVMDEATANIDTETEQLITEALERLMCGRTTVMVAHRLSTIQHCDCIMVMHKGRIREMGTHQELLMQDGIYKKLYELQRQNQ